MRRRLTSSTIALASLASLLVPLSAWADDDREPRFASVQFYTENDTYLRSGTTDEYYTNGIRLALIRNPNVVDNPAWLEPKLEGWCRTTRLCPDVPADIAYGYALGQNMYTPDSIVDPNPQPDDRPWAGYLYFSWIASATSPSVDENGREQPVQNLFELQVGLVGPGAGAKWAQTTVHKLIDSPKPLGWSNQLKNEPTAELIYLWRKKIGSSHLDVVPHWGAALGNVQIYANAGATVRLGYGITSFPQLVIAPSNRDPGQPGKFEAYLFAGYDGRYVARNLFLDGNTFGGGPEIDIHRNEFVFDWRAGFAARYKAWRLDYTVVERSEEFDPPAGRPADGTHRYGSIALSYNVWRP